MTIFIRMQFFVHERVRKTILHTRKSVQTNIKSVEPRSWLLIGHKTNCIGFFQNTRFFKALSHLFVTIFVHGQELLGKAVLEMQQRLYCPRSKKSGSRFWEKIRTDSLPTALRLIITIKIMRRPFNVKKLAQERKSCSKVELWQFCEYCIAVNCYRTF